MVDGSVISVDGTLSVARESPSPGFATDNSASYITGPGLTFGTVGSFDQENRVLYNAFSRACALFGRLNRCHFPFRVRMFSLRPVKFASSVVYKRPGLIGRCYASRVKGATPPWAKKKRAPWCYEPSEALFSPVKLGDLVARAIRTIMSTVRICICVHILPSTRARRGHKPGYYRNDRK